MTPDRDMPLEQPQAQPVAPPIPIEPTLGATADVAGAPVGAVAPDADGLDDFTAPGPDKPLELERAAHVRFANIVYDTDGADVDLPTTLGGDFPAGFNPDLEGAGFISDKTGWCVESFTYEVVPELEWLTEAKKQIRPWQVFDDVRDTMKVKDFVQGLKTQFESLQEMNADYVWDQSYGGAKSILKSAGHDPAEIEAEFPEEFDLLRQAVEEQMTWNFDSLAPGTVLVLQDDELEMGDMYCDEATAAQDKADLLAIATKHGFTEKEVDEVIAHATYGGMGGVGVLADGGDLCKIALGRDPESKEPVEVKGMAILYIRDCVNGSGYYSTGPRAQGSIKVADVPDSIDCGSYSLGQVFGTNEWEY